MKNNNKKNNKIIDDALNDCFESMLSGNDSLESCLARYPEQVKELAPLLQTMKEARAASALSPDPSFRARARYQFRSALYDSMSHKKRPAMAWRWRWATIASTAGVFLLSSTGGVVAASSGSMPGQALYQVKRGIENVQITMTPSQSSRARLYATLADRRVSEIIYVAKQGDAETTEDLTQQFTADLSMVSSIVTPSRALAFGTGSKQIATASLDGSTPEETATNWAPRTTPQMTTVPGAITPPYAPDTTATTATATVTAGPTPTIVVSHPPQVTTTAPAMAPSPTTTMGPITINNLSGIDDPALLRLLQQYSVKNIAELMSILDQVSPSVKAAVLAAIEAATSGYGQILG
jgi:hypothetical protein